MLPINRREEEVVSHGGLTFGGFVTDERMTTSGMLRTFDAVLEHLRAAGVRRLVYKPVPAIYSRVPAEEDRYALFRAGARLVGRDVSSTIALGERLPFSKGRRAVVKRAARGPVRLAWEDDWHGFVDLAAEVLRDRHGTAPTHTGEELALLAGRFPEGIRLRTARVAGELVAGAVLYLTPTVAHTQYLAVSDRGQEHGALDAVVADLIDHYAAVGTRWFDFGISTERQGAELNQGLVRNKESYGARAVMYDRYALDL